MAGYFSDNYQADQSLPADWNDFVQQTGKVSGASMSDYNAWKQNTANTATRNKSLSDFVNQMASNDPTAQKNSQMFGADYGKYGGMLDSFLGQAAPTMNTGNRFETGLAQSEGRLNDLLTNPDSIAQSAAYKWRLGQGLDAVNRQQFAKGMGNSGNRMMALNDYGQGQASQEYDNQFKRIQDLLSSYSANYLGDKNANTAAFGAESAARNQRGSLLSDIWGKAGTNVNQNQQIAGNDRLGWADLWSKTTPKVSTVSAIPGGFSTRFG